MILYQRREVATRTIYWINCDKVERDSEEFVCWVTYYDDKVYRLTMAEFRQLVCTGSFNVEVAVDNRHLVVDNIYRLNGGTKS